jgi:hypothetical protein
MPAANFANHAIVYSLAALLLALPVTAANSAECTTTSGPQRVALLELFTSEGCSSCPPADQWLSRLATRKIVPTALLPLAFHVDYWNYLGWNDPFAQAKFSDRQRQFSRRRGASFVVTPQLLLDGQSYQRPLLREDIESKAQSINQSLPRADIRLSQVRAADRLDARVEVRGVAAAEAPHAQLFLALYENNLETAVKAGENRGALLKHDFVVRELTAPMAIAEGGRLTHETGFALAPHWKRRDLRLAAFVQHQRSGEILQTVSAGCQ